MARSRNLLRFTGGTLDNRFSEAEVAALRKYLVDRGGLLVFDDCGVNAPNQAMLRLFCAQMRRVMPEHLPERIPNDHEIYNNFYAMGGPPEGFDIFWWGTHPPKRKYLEGIFVDDKISVLIVPRDYLCGMMGVSMPTAPGKLMPSVFRFMTNVVVYSLTHGGIADYTNYVPENTIQAQELPTRAPQEARIGATTIGKK